MSKAPSDRKTSTLNTKSDSKSDVRSTGKSDSKSHRKSDDTSADQAHPSVDKTPSAQASSDKILLSDSQWYLSRELSWLEFNRRVLYEALDERTPLLERLKFLAIFCSNLDEYFMVRVAAIKQQIEANVRKQTPDGRTPVEQLQAISQRLRPMINQLHHAFQTELRPKMQANGIYLLNYSDLNAAQRDYLDRYFTEQVFPVLTPLAVDSGHPFPYISNLSLNLAVEIQDKASDEPHFARVKVPKVLPRFIHLPDSVQPCEVGKPCHWTGVPMEQVIAHNIAALFPGMEIKDCCTFRITRNADLSVEEDEADDLMLAIEQELRKRRLGGSVVRMESEAGMNPAMRATLMSELKIQAEDVYDIEGPMGLTDLMALMDLPLPKLQDTPWQPVIPGSWKAVQHEEGETVFDLIRRRDRLVHHPYHAFSGTVQTFITQAANDPGVLAIKMTLYRTSGDSPIVNALVKAAENGKQVVALVELKARFDEENNINWARTLERSGVHVVYGLMGLKTHTKVALVVRREHETIRRYVHIGTGNYNPKTARLYTDLGLLSCRPDLGIDLTDLFNYLTGYSRQQSYQKLLIAPVSLRSPMTQLIRQEAELASNGKPGKITVKMNALVDQHMIEELYKASQAGVEIDLIIRGICCLRPGIPGISQNIRVISVIGRFLEHSRIFHFHNDGRDQYYIGSADWMPRNLDRRVEAMVPVEAPALQQELAELMQICLDDNRQAWEMQPDGTYIQRQPQKGEAARSTHQVMMAQAVSRG
ncbi:MAG: polyphosphate kinase 1 [Phormidesmis sp. RL_2_1]|nr:polyphosphate kinase 1 [Phormidesmis sp. RL_2_1]